MYHCAKYLHEYGLLQYTPFKDSCVFCLRPGHITKKISEYAYYKNVENFILNSMSLVLLSSANQTACIRTKNS